jgi:DNA polymerase III delta subunit
MLYILLGSDDFSKQQFIDAQAKKLGIGSVRVNSVDTVDRLLELGTPDLFANKSLHVIQGSLAVLAQAAAEQLRILADSASELVFVEEKVDKRKKEYQVLLKHKHVTVKDFAIPEGAEFTRWLESRVNALGGSATKPAIQLLANRLRGSQVEPSTSWAEGAPAYTLWQADQELVKLLTYAHGAAVDEAMVTMLSTRQYDTHAWTITNALAERQGAKLFTLLEAFFHEADTTDEKTKTIQLTALLAEQFRSILLVQAASVERQSDEHILELTGWKSGRLYVIKKLAQKFETKVVRDFLSKLEHLDIELKTTATPPRILLDMICAQVV